MAVGLTTLRYVKALFSVADARGERDAVGEELRGLGELFEGAPELAVALREPRLPAESKKKVLLDAGLDTASVTLTDFVSLCLDRGRPEVIVESPEEYARLEREARGVEIAHVETVTTLDDEMRTLLKAQLGKVTGKSIELTEELNTELIGGVRILIGSKMYDGSIRRRLDDIAAHLLSSRIA